MDDLALSMQVVKPNEALLRHLPHNGQRSAFVVVALDNLQQIDTEYLKHSDKVLAMWTVMQEAVQQLDTIRVVSRNVLQLFWVVAVVGFQ